VVNKTEIIVVMLSCFIGLLIGSFWLGGANEWLFKLITAIGSIATAGSFLYIILDNRKIREAQLAQETRQIAHEEKQQGMWEEQKEMLVFQKYELHFKMFNQLLDNLQSEERFRGIYVFRERSQSYQSLFPFNNLSTCEFNMSALHNSSSHPLLWIEEQLKELSDAMLQIVNTPAEEENKLEFYNKLFSITRTLGATIGDVDLAGNVRIGSMEHNTFFNLPRALDCWFALTSIINEIRRFVHLPPISNELCLQPCTTLFDDDFYTHMLKSQPRSNVVQYNYGALDALLKIAQAVCFLSKVDTFNSKELTSKLKKYLIAQASPEDLAKLAKKHHVDHLYGEIIKELEHVSKESIQSKEYDSILNFLSELNELRKKSGNLARFMVETE
jgi:hypothetical protein